MDLETGAGPNKCTRAAGYAAGNCKIQSGKVMAVRVLSFAKVAALLASKGYGAKDRRARGLFRALPGACAGNP